MTNFSAKSIKELNKILSVHKYKKIFILSGKNSFILSGAKKILSKVITDKECYFFFKKSKIPEIQELKEIITKINNFNPDLILAIGGGAVLDYAKIANILNETDNLKFQIINAKYKNVV